MNDYPLPSSALAVWYDGTGLSVRIPPSPGADKGHIITLPDDENGRAILCQILRERATSKSYPRIGTPSAPTQHQIRDWQKQFEATKMIAESKLQRNATQRTKVTSISLDDLGLL